MYRHRPGSVSHRRESRFAEHKRRVVAIRGTAARSFRSFASRGRRAIWGFAFSQFLGWTPLSAQLPVSLPERLASNTDGCDLNSRELPGLSSRWRGREPSLARHLWSARSQSQPTDPRPCRLFLLERPSRSKPGCPDQTSRCSPSLCTHPSHLLSAAPCHPANHLHKRRRALLLAVGAPPRLTGRRRITQGRVQFDVDRSSAVRTMKGKGD